MGNQEMLLAVGCFAVLAGLVLVRRRAAMTDGWLLGTWESDGERTIKEWLDRRPMTDEEAAALRAVIGQMRITWGRRTYAVERNGHREEHPYRLIARDARAAVLRAYDPVEGKEVFVTVNFLDADTYWLYAAGGPLRDYFRRIG
ncbi:MAG: hypothetical protein JWO38_7630 [Gemmataceae bacterium]|nr:hypothetical protein [Gemmataceae bacterium]